MALTARPSGASEGKDRWATERYKLARGKPMSIRAYNLHDYRDAYVGYLSPEILRDAAQKMLVVARRRFPNNPLIFIGLGGSGSSLAIACLLTAKKRVFAVCESEGFEESVENAVTHCYRGLSKEPRFIFVDDHISSGRTINRAKRKLKRVSEDSGMELKIDLIVCLTKHPFHEIRLPHVVLLPEKD